MTRIDACAEPGGRLARLSLSPSTLAFGGLAILLVAIPFVISARGTLTLVNLMGINIVFALSYNMLLGRAGMLSFGHAVYYALPGFVCIHAMRWIADGEGIWSGVPVFLLPAIGFAAGAVFGAVIGWPSCRRSGTAFAMISLGIAELVAAGAYLFDSLFGGEIGIAADRMSGPHFLGLSLGPVSGVYWFIAFWTFLAIAGMYAFSRTPLGQLSEATRDNPERVQFVGFDPMRVRYLVFIFSAAFAGMAGGMAAVQHEVFSIASLSLAVSGSVLISAFLGGARFFVGPIIGAILFTYLGASLSDYTHAWLLYVGLLFISIVMLAPQGIAGIAFEAWNSLRGPHRREYLRGAALTVLAGLCLLVSTVVATEVVLRWSQGRGSVFRPLGWPMPPDGAATWLIVAGGLVLGGAIVWIARARDRVRR